MHENDKKVFLIRYSNALRRIGIAKLLSLPAYYKDKLKKTTNLIDKVLLLEEISELY